MRHVGLGAQVLGVVVGVYVAAADRRVEHGVRARSVVNTDDLWQKQHHDIVTWRGRAPAASLPTIPPRLPDQR